MLFTYILVVFIYHVVGIVLCIYIICQLLLPVIGIFVYFLPEAFCCCLQTCSVNVVLLVMYCMCIPVFIVTSADISQLWVYLCLLTEASCCCLQTCNVYGAWVTL